MMDDAGLDPVQTDEAEAAQNLVGRKNPRQLLLVAQPVLQRQDGRRRPHQRRQEFGELGVGGGFESKENQIAPADRFRDVGAPGVCSESAFGTLNEDAAASDHLEVGPQKKMDFRPMPAAFGAVGTSPRPST